MEYFIFELDEAYVAPRPLNWYGKLDVRALQGKKRYELPERMVFQIEQHMQTVWTDIIMSPCFMISKEAKEIIQMYNPHLTFLRVLFSNQKKRQVKAYYLPFLPSINALTENSKFNLNRSVIHHAEVDGNLMKNRVIAKVGNVSKENCVLIRSDLAESLLNGNLIGIGLRETNMVMPNPSERSKI